VTFLQRAHARATAILLLVVVLAVLGGWAAQHMPAAIFPSVTFPIVKVIADVGEQPVERMIPTVTRPLEQAVDRVPGIRRVLSTTSRGSTEMSAEFTWGTDMATALQRVQGELQRIRPDLPPEARVEAEWMNTSIFPILGYALTSDVAPQWKLRQLAEYTLMPKLIGIQGVARVEIQGGRQREFQVHLDPHKLAGRRLTAADVITALRADNQVLSAGLIERNHELYLTLVDGRAATLAKLGDLSIPSAGGVPVPLAQLGSLAAADAVSYVRTSAQGHEAVLVNIVQQPAANTVAIARGIDALLAANPNLIPKNVTWTVFYDQARFITNSVSGVRDAILIGVALAALVLLVFLRAWRVTAVAVAAIPFTVAVVLLGLAVTGQTVNLMTLGGIAAALGLVADDAIVVVENIHRHRETAASQDPVLSGTSELLPALVGSSLSTIIVFAPFALLSGIAGAFFRPLALTMVLSLVVSFCLAAFAVPAAVRRRREGCDRPPAAPRAPSARTRRRRLPLRLVAWWPLSALMLVALYGVGYFLYRTVETDFLPAMDEGSIILDYWTPAGTSLTDTNAMLDQVDAIVLSLPDVAAYSRRTGTQLGFFITEPNRGDYAIKLKPRGQRRPVEAVIDDLRARIARVEPGIHTDFGQLLEDNIGDLTGGVPQPIDVRIFGEDQQQLQEKAREAAAVIEKVPGVEDVFDGITIAGPALDLAAKPAALARRGLTTDDLHAAIEPATVGTVAGDLRIGERVYDIRVFLDAGGPLATLPVLGSDGSVTPLGDLARISTGEPEAEIDRDNLRTYLGVTARLSGRSLGGAVADIKSRLAEKFVLPAGMSLEYGGLYAQQQSSFKGLLAVLLAGLALVSVVLLFEFGDWRAPLLTALVALAVLAGAFGALIVTGQSLNISSFVGAIMMVGIVGENAIFVIHEARLELLAGSPVREAWAGASQRRLRPVAMTILATAFALAPLALALGEGSQLLQPLAIAVIGGFVLSGPLVLVVLPALYALLDPHGRLAGSATRTEAREAGR
jgi:CzcA family heavy metal efflux pump